MRSKAITYDEWLALSADERNAVLKTWNPYASENIHIPKEACRRLQASSPVRIFRTHVGVFHGGIYVLNPEVAASDLPQLPKPLEQIFDGFPVYYLKRDPRLVLLGDD